MKKLIYSIISIALLTSCASTKLNQIGNLNMVSTRNVNPNQQYVQISTYSNSSERDLKNSRAENIEQAINETVKKIPGGEFMTNTKIYTVSRKGKIYYAVSGDIWGQQIQSFNGFKIGDTVIYKKLFTNKSAKIWALKDDKTCYIQYDGEDKKREVEYNDLTKTQ